MYLAFKPPQMLPTSTLNPAATATGAKSTATSKSSKLKRSLGLDQNAQSPLDYNILREKYGSWADADQWWWIGLGLTGFGSLLYFCF
jgi:Chaperone for protein-folding within the ER, fungal